MPQSIEIISRAAIWHEDAILACRSVERGYCYLPGGHVERDESAAAAVARELLEECGLAIRVGPLLLVSETRFQTGSRWHHEIVLTFHAEPLGPGWERVQSREPEIAFEWIARDALASVDLRPIVVRDALLARPTPTWVSSGF